MPTTTTLPSCLTIQSMSNYHCYIGHVRDTAILQQTLLQTDSHNHHHHPVHSIHVEVENGHDHIVNDQAAFETFLTGLAENLPRLTSFTISIRRTKHLPAGMVARFLRRAPQLQSLTLQDVVLVGESPYELAESLQDHPNLTSVTLRRCYCRPVHVLLRALSKMPHLTKVTMDGSLLEQQRDADAMSALTALLQVRKSTTTTTARNSNSSNSCSKPTGLRALYLEDIAEVGTTYQLTALMDAMLQTMPQQQFTTTTTVLEELSLHVQPHDSLPKNVIQSMARMLRSNTTIHTLTMSWIGGGEILWPLVEALGTNDTLREFRLHHVATKGCYAHPKVLSKGFLQRTSHILRHSNTRLEYLWFDLDSWASVRSSSGTSSSTTTSGKDVEVELYLRANQCGRRRHLFGDVNHPLPSCRPTHEDWMEALWASHDHVPLSYYWLSHNPALAVPLLARTTTSLSS